MNREHQHKLAAGGSVGVPMRPFENQVVPPVPAPAPQVMEPGNADAGASYQKAWPPPVHSILPKTAQVQNGYHTMKTTPRFLLQDLVKQAQASAMDRALIAREAARQMKLASEGGCGEDDDECAKKKKEDEEKDASAVSTEYAMKLANAVEYMLHAKVAESPVGPGEGPSALTVTESNLSGSPPGPGEQGKATQANLPPMTVGGQRSLPGGPANQIPNTINDPPGGYGVQTTAMPAGQGKTAEAVYAGNLDALKKLADQGTSLEDIDAMANAAKRDARTEKLPYQAAGVLGGHALGRLGEYGYKALTKKDAPLGGYWGPMGAVAGGTLGTVLPKDRTKDIFEEYAALDPRERAIRIAGHNDGDMRGLGGALGFGTGASFGAIPSMLAGSPNVGDSIAGSVAGAQLGSYLGAKADRAIGSKDARNRFNKYDEAVRAAQGGGAADMPKEGTAVPPIVDAFLATIKQAADSVSPSHISAGPAVEPDASASEEEVPAKPSGAEMIGSTEGAINYTKQQAKAEPKRDMSSYVGEPALSSAHDTTLQQAFSHTGDAGVKISSANAAMQVSRARELLESIAEAANK